MVLVSALVIVIVVPIQQRAATPTPQLTPIPGGNVQVQGASHSLVHIQEGIVDGAGPSGKLGVRDPIRHLGLIVVVGVCCIWLIMLLVHQLLRFVAFHPRTVEVEPLGPLEVAEHQLVMEAQLRKQMGIEMRRLELQRLKIGEAVTLEERASVEAPLGSLQ